MATKPEVRLENFEGLQNSKLDYEINEGAASNISGFIALGDRVETLRGRQKIGSSLEVNATNSVAWTGVRQDGTQVLYRFFNTTLQYLNGSTWTNIKTDFTAGGKVYFQNYTVRAYSLVILLHSIDGWFLLNPANPSTIVVQNVIMPAGLSAKLARGLFKIKNRRIYVLSQLDNTTVYVSKYGKSITSATAVTGENLGASGQTTYTGTLANVQPFNVSVVVAGGVTLTDNGNGLLTGTGGSGTINYLTGAYTLNYSAPTPASPIASYSYMTETNGGLFDFSFTTPIRLAGEGNFFTIPQLGGGLRNIFFYDSLTYIFKSSAVYVLDDSNPDDTKWTITLFRENLGSASAYAGVESGEGIYFVDEEPKFRRLSYEARALRVVPQSMSDELSIDVFFSNASAFKYLQFILFSGRTPEANANDVTYVYDEKRSQFTVLPFGFSSFTQYNNQLVATDSTSSTTYYLLKGNFNDNAILEAVWEGKNTLLGTNEIKKLKRLIFEGLIDETQTVSFFVSYDDNEYIEVGTLKGTDSNVYSLSDSEDDLPVGEEIVGGQGLEPVKILGANNSSKRYIKEIRITSPKFYRIKLKIKTSGYGYFSFNSVRFFDLREVGSRLPQIFRSSFTTT